MTAVTLLLAIAIQEIANKWKSTAKMEIYVQKIPVTKSWDVLLLQFNVKTLNARLTLAIVHR
jgi:hypothetical protein